MMGIAIGTQIGSHEILALFYYFGGKLFAVDVRTDRAFSFGKPAPLPIDSVVQQIGSPRNYDITPDGKQFIVVLPGSQSETNQRQPLQINMVLNWFEELKQRAFQ